MATLSNYTPSLSEKLVSMLARNWYGDTREGYGQANKLMDVLNLTPVGAATGLYDAGRDLGQGNILQGIAGVGLAAAPLPGAVKKEARQGIRAYHGSPHSFDKFDINQIGTGEGAQAYGHGLYFAEGEGVAKSYKNAGPASSAQYDAINSELSRVANQRQSLREEGFYPGSAGWEKRKADYDRLDEEYNALMEKRSNLGSMYEVNIDADPEQFLDFDKPRGGPPDPDRAKSIASELELIADNDYGLYQNRKMVQNFIEKYKQNPADPRVRKQLDHYMRSANKDYGLDAIEETRKMTEGEAFKLREKEIGPEAARQEMLQKGVPGIKYLDAGSRAAGDGSRNYVVFDDKLISIVKKYGIAGASAMLGYDILANADLAQAAELQSMEPK